MPVFIKADDHNFKFVIDLCKMMLKLMENCCCHAEVLSFVGTF